MQSGTPVITSVNKDWVKLYTEFPERYDQFAQAQDADENALKHVRDHVDLRGKVILDIGAGSGRYTERVAGEAERVYCMDPSAPLLQVAERRAAQAGLSNVVCQVAKAQQVPLPSASVDVVLAMHSITAIGARDFSRPADGQLDSAGHRFAERERAVLELLRVLRPGGWLFSLSPAPDNYGGGLSALVLGEWNAEWSRGKAEFLRWMTDRWGFVTTAVRGDWVFPDPQVAAEVYGFVYGADAANYILEHDVRRIDNKLVMQSLRKTGTDQPA